jgi:hypothetical protein
MTLLPLPVSSIPDSMLVLLPTRPLSNECLQVRQRVGPKRRMSSSLDSKFEGTIEARDLIHP